MALAHGLSTKGKGVGLASSSTFTEGAGSPALAIGVRGRYLFVFKLHSSILASLMDLEGREQQIITLQHDSRASVVQNKA